MLAGQQDEAHQGAEGVDKGDDLGRQTAARAADGLGPGPPLYGAHYVKRYVLRANAVCWTKSGPASLLSGRRLAAPPCIRSALEGVLTNIPRSWAKARPGERDPSLQRHYFYCVTKAGVRTPVWGNRRRSPVRHVRLGNGFL